MNQKPEKRHTRKSQPARVSAQSQPIQLFANNHSCCTMLWIALAATAIVFSPIQFVAAANDEQVATIENGKTYTDLASIRELDPNNTADVPVDFEATVTFIDRMREFIFVQEGDDAIFVYRPDAYAIDLGQRVRVCGRLAKGDLLPIVSEPLVTLISEGELPSPKKISAITVENDCEYVAMEFDILQSAVGAEETLLYAKTDDGKDVCIQVLLRSGVTFPHASSIAGHRVLISGIMGLQMDAGAFLKPGKNKDSIIGYKIFCNSPDHVKIVDEKEIVDSNSAQVIGLPLLKRDDFPEERFLTFAQICLIEETQPPEFVAFDGSTSIRFRVHSTSDLQPGMLLRIGGNKRIDSSGQSQYEVDYMRHLNLSEFPQPNAISVSNAVRTFEADRRIAVEGTPHYVEDSDGSTHLILKQGKSKIAVQFQDAALDSLTSLDPSFAKKVWLAGVAKNDNRCDFKLVVVRPDDVRLIERKTSLSRTLVIGLGTLLGVCTLAAFWIRLLKSQIAQKQQFESIFDNAGCPIIVFNGNLKIIDANQLAADMTKYSKEELRSLSVPDIDPHIPMEQVKKNLVMNMKRQGVAIFPTKVRTNDGEVLDVEVHARNLTQSDDPEKAKHIAIFPDTTARTKYENELKEARDEAIKANKAKSQFVASMSHELRTPLNGVIGMTQLLENTELTRTQADYLAACRTSGESLLTVIGDILDFSKMEAGKLELEPRPTKLIPFIENVVRATSLQQGTRNVDLASFVDPRLSRSVMVDSDRLRQVIFNLTGNAAKFTSQGSITVTARCSEVTDQYADVRFVVADTGIGIPEDLIPILFEAFEQFDSSTTRKFGGTGLGLTICKQIIELMGGEIQVESAEGEGSKFMVNVRLPFAPQTETGEDAELEFTPTGRRVALVGMSGPISEILHEMFEEYSVDASFFSDTETLPTGEFDVVLLNTKGGLNSVGKYIAQQSAMSCDDAPILIPVVPANCVIEQQDWEIQGAAAPIYKPFTQTRFLQPVNSRQQRGERPVADRSLITSLADRDLKVLICEDNPINQMFAKEVCRRAGIKFVMCENGHAGIETLTLDTKFDVVFMDCHMPVMDGFEASRRIQEMIKEGTIPEIPIIALTANTLTGDRERCLEAGMDDYLAKPFEIEDFLEKISDHTDVPKIGRPIASKETESEEWIFNFEKLLNQFNDRGFALDISEQFYDTLPGYREDLESFSDQEDVDLVLNVAHRLKGTAGTVQADRICKLALEIESAGRNGQLDDLELQIAEILLEFENFNSAYEEVVTKG